MIYATVSALVYALLNHLPEKASSNDANRLTQSILTHMGRQPDYLRLPFAGVLWAFGCCGLWHGGALFHRLPMAVRCSQLNSWRHSPFSFARDLIRFFDSLTMFFLYGQPSAALHRQLYGPTETPSPSAASITSSTETAA